MMLQLVNPFPIHEGRHRSFCQQTHNGLCPSRAKTIPAHSASSRAKTIPAHSASSRAKTIPAHSAYSSRVKANPAHFQGRRSANCWEQQHKQQKQRDKNKKKMYEKWLNLSFHWTFSTLDKALRLAKHSLFICESERIASFNSAHCTTCLIGVIYIEFHQPKKLTPSRERVCLN